MMVGSYIYVITDLLMGKNFFLKKKKHHFTQFYIMKAKKKWDTKDKEKIKILWVWHKKKMIKQ